MGVVAHITERVPVRIGLADGVYDEPDVLERRFRGPAFKDSTQHRRVYLIVYTNLPSAVGGGRHEVGFAYAQECSLYMVR